MRAFALATQRCLARAPAVLLALCVGLLPVVGTLKLEFSPEPVFPFFVMLLRGVGLAPGAVLQLNITSQKPGRDVALVILSRSQLQEWTMEFPLRLGDDAYSSYLVSHSRYMLQERLLLRHQFHTPFPDEYYVGVMNPHLDTLMLSGELSYVNPGGQHLPLQLAHMPALSAIASAAFLVLMQTSTLLLSTVWHRGATALHALLVCCVTLKAFELAVKANLFSLLAEHGDTDAWRFKAWQFLVHLHDISEVLVILMIASGWRVLRPRLTRPELRFVATSTGFSAALSVLQACNDFSEFLEASFTLAYFVVKGLCYLVTIFAMNFNLQLLTVYLSEAPVGPSAIVVYRKLKVYVRFRCVFLAIVFRPSVMLWLQLSVLTEQGTEWLADALTEASLWIVYAGLLVALQPDSDTSRLLRPLRSSTPSEDAASPSNGGAHRTFAAPVSSRRVRIAQPQSGPARTPVADSPDLGISTVPYMPLAGGPQ